MGGYFSRNRAWVHIAFYDEYANKHIGVSTALSVLFMVPLYWYGIYINRCKEQHQAAFFYNWHFTEKRNRLTHNMIMEHFEVHTEQVEDLLTRIALMGSNALEGPDGPNYQNQITQDDLALIDELSGLPDFLENFINAFNLPVAV